MAVHVPTDLFFILVIAPLLSLSIYWHPKVGLGCQEVDIERKEDMFFTIYFFNKCSMYIFVRVIYDKNKEKKEKKFKKFPRFREATHEYTLTYPLKGDDNRLHLFLYVIKHLNY